jgi:hypothetical protein
VVLQQETGREVTVELKYWWNPLPGADGKDAGVRLISDAEALPVEVVGE